jgi:hypothetical protein
MIKSTLQLLSCYDLGFRYGKCSRRSLKGLPCRPENDFIIPERCRNTGRDRRWSTICLLDGLNYISIDLLKKYKQRRRR